MNRFHTALVAALAMVIIAGCTTLDVEDAESSSTSSTTSTTVNRNTSATSTTSTTTTAPTTAPVTEPPAEGSFDAHRLVCTEKEVETFDDIVAKLTAKLNRALLPAEGPNEFNDELETIFEGPQNMLTLVVGRSEEGSCLRAFLDYLPTFAQHSPAPSGGGSSGGGGSGSGGGSDTGSGTTGTGTPVGNNCGSGKIWNGTECVIATPVVVPPAPSTSVPVVVVVPPVSDPNNGSIPPSSEVTMYCPQYDAQGNLIPACA